jgi:sugar phosphate permease
MKDTSPAFGGGFRPWFIWVLAAFFYLYEFAVRVAPSVMVDDIQLKYGLDAAGFGASMSMYYHVYGPMQILVGPLLDYFGARYLLVGATLCVALGCFVPFWMEGVGALTFARGIMGLGSAFAFVGAMYVATLYFPKHRLAFFSGITTALGMAGGIAGEAPMAKVVAILGWEHTFWYAGFLGLFLAFALYLMLPNRTRTPQSEALQVSFLQTVLAVVRNPQVWVIGMIACVLYAPLAVFADLWGTEYVQSVTGAERIPSALANSMLYVGWLIGGPIVGLLAGKINNNRTLLLGSTLCTTIALAVFLSFTEMSLPMAQGLLLAIGLASSAQVVCFAAAMHVSPHFAQGSAVAVTNMFVMLLGGGFQWLAGVILKAFSESGPMITKLAPVGSTLIYAAEDFRLAMLMLPALSALGILLCFRLKS